jgi:hypothetical protein
VPYAKTSGNHQPPGSRLLLLFIVSLHEFIHNYKEVHIKPALVLPSPSHFDSTKASDVLFSLSNFPSHAKNTMLFYILVLTILRFTYCVNGTVLPLLPRDPEPQINQRSVNGSLAARNYPPGTLTGYPYNAECSGTTHYTWYADTSDTCVEYWENGNVLPMSSIKVTALASTVVLLLYFEPGCHYYAGDGTYTTIMPGEITCISPGVFYGWGLGEPGLSPSRGFLLTIRMC